MCANVPNKVRKPEHPTLLHFHEGCSCNLDVAVLFVILNNILSEGEDSVVLFKPVMEGKTSKVLGSDTKSKKNSKRIVDSPIWIYFYPIILNKVVSRIGTSRKLTLLFMRWE